MCFGFFFSSRRRHTRCSRDWSSDVCSSDLAEHRRVPLPTPHGLGFGAVKLHSVSEGWLIALDQLRANKLRSALTILGVVIGVATVMADRKSTRLNSSHGYISYAVFCLKKKKKT